MDTQVKDTKEGEVIGESSTDISELTSLVKELVTPFAQAQEKSEEHATKRAAIVAGVANKAIYALFGFTVLIIGLAAYALSQGNDNLTQTLVIALLAFLGGIGTGKGLK